MTAAASESGITVTVNGQARRLREGSTVSALLDVCGFPSQKIAVAVNRQVIPRSRHPDHQLHHGDEVDAVQAVGGG